MTVGELIIELKRIVEGDPGLGKLSAPVFFNQFIKNDGSDGADIYEPLPIDSVEISSFGCMLFSNPRSVNKNPLDLSKISCPWCEHREEALGKAAEETYKIYEIKRTRDFVVVTCTNGDVFSVWRGSL